MTAELIARARKSYRSLDGVIVVSPRLVAELADALESASVEISPRLTWRVVQCDKDGVTYVQSFTTEAEAWAVAAFTRPRAEIQQMGGGQWVTRWSLENGAK